MREFFSFSSWMLQLSKIYRFFEHKNNWSFFYISLSQTNDLLKFRFGFTYNHLTVIVTIFGIEHNREQNHWINLVIYAKQMVQSHTSHFNDSIHNNHNNKWYNIRCNELQRSYRTEWNRHKAVIWKIRLKNHMVQIYQNRVNDGSRICLFISLQQLFMISNSSEKQQLGYVWLLFKI